MLRVATTVIRYYNLAIADITYTGETAELLWQELSDDEGTYQAHDIVFDKHCSKGSLIPLLWSS